MTKSKLKKHIDKKSYHNEEIDTEGTWAISYGDMITLLLTFFIIFFSINKNDDQEKRKVKLKLSLLNALNSDHNKLFAAKTKQSRSISNLRADEELKQKIDLDFLKLVAGKAHDLGDRVILEFPEISFFYSGGLDLTPEGLRALKNFSTTMNPFLGNYKFSIQAFTDERKVKFVKGRKFSDNLELSTLRGLATMRFLQKNGFPLSKMSVGGFGEMKWSKDELSKLKNIENKNEFVLNMSRKVIIVIEPETT